MFRLLVEFKQAAYRILREHPAAADDLRFRSQLQASAAGAVSTFEEGYKRRSSGVFHLYLGYSSASLAEATRWLSDGAERGYYPRRVCDEAFALSRRAAPGLEALQRSLRPYIEAERQARRAGKTPAYLPKKPARATPPPARPKPPNRTRRRRTNRDSAEPTRDSAEPTAIAPNRPAIVPNRPAIAPNRPRQRRTDRASAEPTAIVPNRPRQCRTDPR